MISGGHIFRQITKEKIDVLCIESINISELEDSLTSLSLNFTQKATYDFGQSYFKSLDKITFCKICSIEKLNSLLYDHIFSKEHKDIEEFFIKKCMTYCEKGKKELKNHEWREHTLSEVPLERAGQNYCELCKLTNYTSVGSKDSQFLYQRGTQHQDSDVH